MKGTVFVDEQALPIVDIYLRDGLVVVVAQRRGPMTLPGQSEARIHDPQGNLVLVTPFDAGQHAWRANRRGTMTVVLPIRIDAVQGWPR